MQQKEKMPLGALLIKKGVISEDQLRIALTEQTNNKQPLGKLLVQLGFVSEATVRDALSEKLDQESVDLSNLLVDATALQLLPKEVAQRFRTFPMRFDAKDRRLALAMADTNNIIAIDQIQAMLGRDIVVTTNLAAESEILRAIDQFYGFELSIDGILREIETGGLDEQTQRVDSEEYSQPIVRLVDAILAEAIQYSASDIHFEPEQFFVRIRYRIDGLLRQVRSLHKTYWPAMAVRLKVISGMNIAETRAPQDGRISMVFSGRQIDFRSSAQPTVHGENVVLRILDRQKGIVPLEALGLADDSLEQLRLMIARPEGIILVTGPTGSGKTTTLYSILNYINSETINIMTLEDPVEYPMGLIRQTSVNEGVRMGFADGIRSMMRQDPDVILVGEIRDKETAEMALSAAMTGHQVYSTLHTNSALGAIPRLLDMGILPDIMAGNIIGIIAQRLVRKLCSYCREPHVPNEIECRLLNIDAKTYSTIYKAVGCEKCSYQGYKGRMAVTEVLKLTPVLDEMISRRATIRELHKEALANGFRPLVEDGVRRVLDGSTSLEEVSRVIDFTSRIPT